MKKIILLLIGMTLFGTTACGRVDEMQVKETNHSVVHNHEAQVPQSDDSSEKPSKEKESDNYTVEENQLRFVKPTVILSIDDGTDSDYELNYPYFKAKGLRFTSFINATMIGQPGYMTIEHLHEMNRDNFDIQDHFYEHIHLNECTVDELKEGLEKTDEWFEANGLEKPVALAAPYGNLKNEVSTTVGDERNILRATIWMKPEGIPVWYQTLNKKQAREIYTENIDLQDQTRERLEEIKAEIDEAHANHALINLYFHRTLEENPDSNYHNKAEYLHEIVDYLQEKNFHFMTYKELDQALKQIKN